MDPFRRLLRGILGWVLREEFDLLTAAFAFVRDARPLLVEQARTLEHQRSVLGRHESELAALARLPGQLAALQALDADFHAGSKLVVLAHVGGADRVKIIPIDDYDSVFEYERKVRALESQYGARLRYVDAPFDDANLLRRHLG